MTLGPRVRKLLLTVHVVSSVGWLGGVAAFLALAIVGVTSDDPGLVRGVYIASEPLALFMIVPFAIASLVTGVVQSLATTWGLLRHYWVVAKLAVTVFAATFLLLYTQTIDSVAGAAAGGADLAAMRSPSFVVHSLVGLALLLFATVLAVYKPRGLTRHGWRKQQRQLRAGVR